MEAVMAMEAVGSMPRTRPVPTTTALRAERPAPLVASRPIAGNPLMHKHTKASFRAQRFTATRTPAIVASAAAAATMPTAPLTAKAVSFVKYQGLGNDFILVDNRQSEEPLVTPEQAIALCDRHFGIGGDGVIFALPGKEGTDYTMRIYNSDGSEPEMCGNGIRCMARFLSDLESAPPRKYDIHTLAGIITPEVLPNGQVTVDMGEPILEGPKIPTSLAPTRPDGSVVGATLDVAGNTWKVTCVSMGNPHCITFENDKGTLRVDDIPLESIGPLFERNAVFPARINTEFVEVISRTHLKMRVWERGAGATLACGTGTCALVVAAVLEGRAERSCRVDLPGGPLFIDWREDNNRIYMTGPAEVVFSGSAVVR